MKRRIISICCILSAFILFTAMNVFAEENSQSEILYSNRLKAMEVIPDDFDMEKSQGEKYPRLYAGYIIWIILREEAGYSVMWTRIIRIIKQ